MCAPLLIGPDTPEFFGGEEGNAGCIISESPLQQIKRKIGAIEVLLGEIDALATKIRRPVDDPESFDAELHRMAFDLGMSLSDLYRKAWEINRDMARRVDSESDDLAEIHACRRIRAGIRRTA